VTAGGGDPALSDDGDSGRIGPFSSWRALYATVIAYTAGMIALLYVLTRILDHSG